VEEIIIFVERNRFHVELKVGEHDKYIRDANTNIHLYVHCTKKLRCDCESMFVHKISDEKERNCCYIGKS
jgi:hypothetical protein